MFFEMFLLLSLLINTSLLNKQLNELYSYLNVTYSLMAVISTV